MTETEWQTHRLPSGTIVRLGVDPERQGVHFCVLEREHWHGFAIPINDAVEVLKWLSDQVRPWSPKSHES